MFDPYDLFRKEYFLTCSMHLPKHQDYSVFYLVLRTSLVLDFWLPELILQLRR